MHKNKFVFSQLVAFLDRNKFNYKHCYIILIFVVFNYLNFLFL